MSAPRAVLFLLLTVGLCGCVVTGSSQSPPPSWTTGFWFWEGSSLDTSYSGRLFDALYVQVGTIRQPEASPYNSQSPAARWSLYGQLPRSLPPARDYWFVFRYERQGVPTTEVAAMLASEVVGLQAVAKRRNLHVAGIQLDIDSPTSNLAQYAAFLHEVRTQLPDTRLSITALLDWFRTGAAIDQVIAQVDEFVPQFYDAAPPAANHASLAAIGVPIDAATWNPRFNRFHKPFRIGIPSFGRVMRYSNEQRTGYQRRLGYYSDPRPLEIAVNPAFQLEAKTNPLQEIILNYRARHEVRMGFPEFETGDILQFIICTPESIRAAVQSARHFGGYFRGVVFFRWPSSNESYFMQPDEVLAAAAGGSAPPQNRVHIVQGHCAAVECVDVYLEGASPISPVAVRYRIHSSTELEYFMPADKMPARLTGPSDIEVSLPPYCSRGRLLLGRAVSLKPGTFTIQEEK